ncbi:hypothetical protein C8J56DRAFT_900106 [Mycena floridula]|nr:hypothetical protein C8J56DRAFT_900106 [Mycena floridula]
MRPESQGQTKAKLGEVNKGNDVCPRCIFDDSAQGQPRERTIVLEKNVAMLGQWTLAFKLKQKTSDDEILFNPASIPYTEEISLALTPFSVILKQLLHNPDKVHAEDCPVKVWTEEQCKHRVQPTDPIPYFAGPLSAMPDFPMDDDDGLTIECFMLAQAWRLQCDTGLDDPTDVDMEAISQHGPGYQFVVEVVPVAEPVSEPVAPRRCQNRDQSQGEDDLEALIWKRVIVMKFDQVLELVNWHSALFIDFSVT